MAEQNSEPTATSKETLANLKSSGEASAKADVPLFPAADLGTRLDFGTNNTLELLEHIPSKVVEMKLNDVLTAVKTVDNLCDYPRCKARTSLIGQNCELCRKRFCFKHGLPEVHGCGEAVKKEERKKFMHPKPAKTVRQEEELAQAKKKLQVKLKDMQVGRMQKTGSVGGGSSTTTGTSNAGGGARKKKGK